MKQLRIKIAIVVVATLLSLFSLYPSFQLYFMVPGKASNLAKQLSQATTKDDSLRIVAEQDQLEQERARLHKRSLHLGLDLVGGMHLTLEVDKSKLAKDQNS